MSLDQNINDTCSGEGPKYVLNGIDRFSIFGEHSVLLGVYAETEDIEKEIRAIREAVERGNRTYELQFCMEEPFGEERNEPE